MPVVIKEICYRDGGTVFGGPKSFNEGWGGVGLLPGPDKDSGHRDLIEVILY